MGVLSLTVGDLNGVTTVVVALGGIYKVGSEVETLSLHVLPTIEKAIKLLNGRGQRVELILMDNRIDERQEEVNL